MRIRSFIKICRLAVMLMAVLAVVVGQAQPPTDEIVFSRWVAGPGQGQSDLYTLNVGTGEITQLTDTEDDERDPTWSPDGATLAFVRVAADLSGAALLRADAGDIAPAEPLPIGGYSPGQPVWSPDGCCIAFTFVTDISQIFVYDLENERSTPVSVTEWLSQGSAAWSPDGETMVFTGNLMDGVRPTLLYAVPYAAGDLPTDERTVLTTETDGYGQPSFGPDGTLYAVRQRDRQLVRLDDDGAVTVVVDMTVTSSVSFSPDGARMVFSAMDTDENEVLFIADADGTNREPVTFPLDGARTRDQDPAWRP